MNYHDVTFHGLHKWFCSMYEKLGWMAKAIQHDNKLKVDAYIESLAHLESSIKRKHEKTRDADNRDDLMILLNQSLILQAYMKKMTGVNITKDNSREECSGSNSHDATFQGLHCWLKAKYEKLGWMCLAQEHSNKLKVESYLDSLKRLKASLDKKMNDLEEKDRKNDIEILQNDVCTLQLVASKLLDGSNMSRKSTMQRIVKRTKRVALRR